MPINYKVLGQSAPGATTNVDLYTVPSATEAIVSTLTVTNRATSSTTFRVAVRPAGASISDEHYVVYDAEIAAKSVATFTIGLTLSATDVVTVYAGSSDLSFGLFGSEVS